MYSVEYVLFWFTLDFIENSYYYDIPFYKLAKVQYTHLNYLAVEKQWAIAIISKGSIL